MLLSNPMLRALPAQNATKSYLVFVSGMFHTTPTDRRGHDKHGCTFHGLSRGRWQSQSRAAGSPPSHSATEPSQRKAVPQALSKTPLFFPCSTHFQKVNFILFPSWHKQPACYLKTRGSSIVQASE